MFDIDTYLTTQNTLGGPIIRQLDRPVTYGSEIDDNEDTEMSVGAATGHAIGLLLIAGILLYFCLAR